MFWGIRPKEWIEFKKTNNLIVNTPGVFLGKGIFLIKKKTKKPPTPLYLKLVLQLFQKKNFFLNLYFFKRVLIGFEKGAQRPQPCPTLFFLKIKGFRRMPKFVFPPKTKNLN